MSGVLAFACMLVSVICGGVAAGLVVRARLDRVERARRRREMLGSEAPERDGYMAYEGNDRVLRYLERLTRRLFIGETRPIALSVRAKRAGATRAGVRFREIASAAGCSKVVTVSAYCEARFRLAAMGALLGVLLGSVFSTELGLVMGISGILVGWSLPLRSIKAAAKSRTVQAERHLSEMLEVVALGLRSGLNFDRSFELYGTHFDNEFARSCTIAYRRWALGLSTREESLRDFAESYDCEQLRRAVDSMVRSLRFGSSLADILEEAAAQSRETYRTSLAERVAKAPVKMMLPTGTLILPAMLLLVLGPILLELAGGF